MFAGHKAELKMEGVAEAARDPKSKVTSEDAQKVMEDEVKRAGVPAYRFDPDASPEDKAAAARAAKPAGFQNDKKAAVGIVTDMDGGPDQYDLPPPTTAGALGDPTTGKANGQIHATEKASYVESVGWAPRFGEGTMTEAEKNASLLDHTTFLEGKLDDKFFGDWYHNAAIIVFACLMSWTIAALGGGLGWVFLVMAGCGTYYRTSIRRVRRNYRDDVSRELAKARLETDVESLEWINSFLVKFWPIYAPVLCETIINSVDQVLSTSTPAFLDSMRLKYFTLGTKPPRLDHVKTYPKAQDDLVLMDWKFSFTPGDRMDMTARQLSEKINPKVILEVRVGKGVISKGLDIIVEDFAFSGLMRVRMKLQLPFPHIEKVEICFLGRPDIDYVCKPLGGDTLGFDINFIPGLESFIKEQIHGNLAPIMYDPNVFPIEIAKMLSGSPVDQAIGVLAITLHGAQALKNPDKLAGAPDPYVTVSINNRTVLGKTKTVKQNANPRWNETVYVIVTSLVDALTLHVFDFNDYRKDKDLGTATFALDQLEAVPEHENLQLEVKANNKPRGVLQADVRFFPVLEGLKLEDGTVQPPPESNTGIARFTVEQAQDLDGSKSMVGSLNPYAVLLLNGKEIHTSKHLKRTNKPIWPDGSKEFLVTDRKSARLGVVVKDEREFGTDSVIGSYQIRMDDMVKLMDQGRDWFQLHGANKGRIKLGLQWKSVALRGVEGGSGGYITPIGVMRLHFKNARNLKNVETMGKSDPYVRVLLSGVVKGKTVTFDNDLNPNWDEVIYVPMHSPRERLTLEVMDYQNIGKDRSLGLIELGAADYIHETEDGEYLVHEPSEHSDGLRMNGRGQAKGVLNYTAAFYPTIPTVDPEEEELEKKEMEEALRTGRERAGSRASRASSLRHSRTGSKTSLVPSRKSIDDPVNAHNEKEREAGAVDTSLAHQLDQAEKAQKEEMGGNEEMPLLRLNADDLQNYESGLLVFRLLSGEFSRPHVYLEVVMDDMVFPSYASSKTTSRTTEFGETGDAMVRELDLSRITLRLVEKQDKRGEGEASDAVFAKLQGDTLDVLKQCLYKPTELTLRGQDGSPNKVKVLMKYLPVKMKLDPSESINNQGELRVDILDADDLPSADRNGFSDPFCQFKLNGETVYKTKVQKKTLHPAWNEYFTTSVPSRTAAQFTVKVMDWDIGGSADFLGDTGIALDALEPNESKEVTLALNSKKGPGTAGVLRLRLLFKSAYVTRTRRGTATFHGTIGPAGKVIGAPVKVVGKVGTGVGGGIAKGASFMFGRNKSKNDRNSVVIPPAPEQVPANGTTAEAAAAGATTANGSAEKSDGAAAIPSIETPERSKAAAVASPPDGSPAPFADRPESRRLSFGARSTSLQASSAAAAAGAAASPGTGAASTRGEMGTAEIAVLAASGFPESAKVQVIVKQLGAKAKEVLKTKPVKGAGGEVKFENETHRAACAADTQFQVSVKDHHTFGGGDDLGDALLFVDDSSGAAGSERALAVGAGSVTLRTAFVAAAANANDAASLRDSKSMRRSLLSKRDNSRQGTPS